jgi:hypothetical protein
VAAQLVAYRKAILATGHGGPRVFPVWYGYHLHMNKCKAIAVKGRGGP